ncbi:MAG: hypothetical protein CVU38_05515 [Chloroflexi bacterium HGW-Chloroflexi-1]|nr:MAG: hypothetical protein CVU38_05515 [Chloroflexi bacterium HGW-Chloroflexi-1]
MIAVESLLFLLGGIAIAIVLIQVFGRGGDGARSRTGRNAASVKLVRSVKLPENIEESRLVIDDQVILSASSAGLRPADYVDEIEQLETIATRIASALGVSLELARLDPKEALLEAGVPVRQLPHPRSHAKERE